MKRRPAKIDLTVRGFSPEARAAFDNALAQIVAERVCRRLGLNRSRLPLAESDGDEYPHAIDGAQ